MERLDGANCAGLPGFVIDKYFGCNVSAEPLRAMVALAICDNCEVQPDCREEALHMRGLQTRGVIGGVTVIEIKRARRWLAYESGVTDQIPTCRRPEWLGRPEAAETVEQFRVEADPDEDTDR